MSNSSLGHTIIYSVEKTANNIRKIACICFRRTTGGFCLVFTWCFVRIDGIVDQAECCLLKFVRHRSRCSPSRWEGGDFVVFQFFRWNRAGFRGVPRMSGMNMRVHSTEFVLNGQSRYVLFIEASTAVLSAHAMRFRLASRSDVEESGPRNEQATEEIYEAHAASRCGPITLQHGINCSYGKIFQIQSSANLFETK